MRLRVCRRVGFTLLELLITLLILAAIVQTAVLSFAPSPAVAVAAAATEVANALRFARQEAVRTGAPAIVAFDATNRIVRVYRPDFSVTPAAEVLLVHPLDRRPYSVALDSHALIGATIALEASFKFSDGSSAPSVGFNTGGTPGKITSNSTLVPTQLPGLWRGPWQSDVSYRAGDWVIHHGTLYDCLQEHDSDDDFQENAARWAPRSHTAPITISAAGHSHDVHVDPITGFTWVHSR